MVVNSRLAMNKTWSAMVSNRLATDNRRPAMVNSKSVLYLCNTNKALVLLIRVAVTLQSNKVLGTDKTNVIQVMGTNIATWNTPTSLTESATLMNMNKRQRVMIMIMDTTPKGMVMK